MIPRTCKWGQVHISPTRKKRTRPHLSDPRNQDASVQGTGLAHAIPADALTMRRLRRPRPHAAIGAGAIHIGPPAHSCDLRIGVVCKPLHSDPFRTVEFLHRAVVRWRSRGG